MKTAWQRPSTDIVLKITFKSGRTQFIGAPSHVTNTDEAKRYVRRWYLIKPEVLDVTILVGLVALADRRIGDAFKEIA